MVTSDGIILDESGYHDNIVKAKSFTVAEYAKALRALPMNFLSSQYEDLRHLVFHGNIIVTNGSEILMYKDGAWAPILYVR